MFLIKTYRRQGLLQTLLNWSVATNADQNLNVSLLLEAVVLNLTEGLFH